MCSPACADLARLFRRYDEIVGKLSPFLKGTGYNMKTDVTFIPVSGFTGANIKESVDRKLAPWVE